MELLATQSAATETVS